MKRLFILIAVCMIGMVVPQGVFAAATVTVSDGTVTINTDKAGDLKAYLQSASDADKAAIRNASSIVFDGKFNKEDLDALNGAGCCTQSTVDMSQAYFIKSSSLSGSYTLYHDTPSNPENGKTYIIGATKYESKGQVGSRDWTEKDDSYQNQWNARNVLASEVNTLSYDYDTTLKLPTSLNYYVWDNNSWTLIPNPTSTQIAQAAEAPDQCTSANINRDYTWLKDNYSIVKARSTDCTYRYFVYSSTIVYNWDDSNGNNYTDGQIINSWYSSKDDADSPSGEGLTIFAGGEMKAYSNGQWVNPSQTGGDEEYDYTQMSFSYWGSNVTTAITSYNAGSDLIATDLCNGCSNLTNLTIGSGTVHSITTEGNKPPLTNLTIGNKVAKLGNGTDGVFADYSSITNLTFESGGTDPLEIEKNCFIRCRGISNELIIPARTTLIEQNAFTNLEALTTITFEETQTNWPALVIKKEAFSNISNVERVNVNIDPSKKMMICEYNAFDYNELVAQTNVNGKSAVLHFPEEFFDFYAGNWKRNMTFDQDNLNQIKDGLTYGRTLNGITYVSGNTQSFADYTQIDTNKTDGKLDGYYHANGYPNTMYAPANGWQQFARTDTGIDIVIKKGKYFRTYSTENAQAKPEWMTIYRVTNFSDGYEEGKSNASSRTEANEATKEATVQEITESETGGNSLIPANTGVIRVDEVEKDALYYFMDWSYTGIAYQETWGFPHNETVGNAKVNFMVPTNDEEATQFGPVDRDATGITHRNFVLTADAVFMRAKPLTMAANRAYLKLPAGMFHWKDEGEGSSQIEELNGSSASQYSKISLLFIDDFEDVNGGIATEIINAIEEDMYKNDSFYTIQGVKVSKPTTKGVYIHNGKKVYIK